MKLVGYILLFLGVVLLLVGYTLTSIPVLIAAGVMLPGTALLYVSESRMTYGPMSR